jgi:hypothetical protein
MSRAAARENTQDSVSIMAQIESREVGPLRTSQEDEEEKG